ncbi:uncharacterized protein PgNI_11712 [Pyricularia grisea]|uniref:Uncharacterized protein n=1 Tax=Pyricularia grisea TaxID=148305 RepID=A0A6P8AND9_PYRGI|nr:uncharacterized protein PgNI_11712 [Pyricularia grisea]TLD03557.1 hypothetical protein PgNI_11712 [Pyricularia grisea]
MPGAALRDIAGPLPFPKTSWRGAHRAATSVEVVVVMIEARRWPGWHLGPKAPGHRYIIASGRDGGEAVGH